MVMEQLTKCMPTGLQIWLKERKPKTTEEVGKLADDYIAAWKSTKTCQEDVIPSESEKRGAFGRL